MSLEARLRRAELALGMSNAQGDNALRLELVFTLLRIDLGTLGWGPDRFASADGADDAIADAAHDLFNGGMGVPLPARGSFEPTPVHDDGTVDACMADLLALNRLAYWTDELDADDVKRLTGAGLLNGGASIDRRLGAQNDVAE